jgi:two-component system, response regulator PdtaR
MFATQPGLTPARPTVLVVEDEVLIRLSIADALRNRGLQVLEASNAEEAMAILESALPIDVVFTDIRMPGRLNGAELSRHARERYPRIKLVLTSGQRLDEYAEASADVFLAKPYDMRTAVREIESLLSEFGHEPGKS